MASFAGTPRVTSRRTGRQAALLLISVPLLFMALFSLLGAIFDYPDILRRDTAEVLTRYAQGGLLLKVAWYGMLASALAFIPLAVLAGQALEERPEACVLPAVFGVLAGLVQALGFARWVFLTPYLSELSQLGSPPEVVDTVFRAFHLYAGVGLGEHLGYLFTGLWTLLIAQSSGLRSTRYGQVGTLLGLGILLGMLEATGFTLAPLITSVSYLLWAGWMVALGLLMVRPQGSGRR